jgi:hypothetical protein
MRVHTAIASWRPGERSHDLSEARAFVSVGKSFGSQFAYEVEPRPVSRGQLTEVTTSVRSYRVALVMRQADDLEPSHAPRGDEDDKVSACVIMRWSPLGNESAADARVIGKACVSEPARAAADARSWSTVDLQKDGVTALLRLQTAQVHRLTIEGASSAAMVHVDQLRLVQVDDATAQ